MKIKRSDCKKNTLKEPYYEHASKTIKKKSTISCNQTKQRIPTSTNAFYRRHATAMPYPLFFSLIAYCNRLQGKAGGLRASMQPGQLHTGCHGHCLMGVEYSNDKAVCHGG